MMEIEHFVSSLQKYEIGFSNNWYQFSIPGIILTSVESGFTSRLIRFSSFSFLSIRIWHFKIFWTTEETIFLKSIDFLNFHVETNSPIINLRASYLYYDNLF